MKIHTYRFPFWSTTTWNVRWIKYSKNITLEFSWLFVLLLLLLRLLNVLLWLLDFGTTDFLLQWGNVCLSSVAGRLLLDAVLPMVERENSLNTHEKFLLINQSIKFMFCSITLLIYLLKFNSCRLLLSFLCCFMESMKNNCFLVGVGLERDFLLSSKIRCKIWILS